MAKLIKYLSKFYRNLNDEQEAIAMAESEFHEDMIFFMIAGFILSSLAVVAIFVNCKQMKYPSRRHGDLQLFADYIQEKAFKGFAFYVKDNRFGLLNWQKKKVLINAEYDLLEWKKTGKTLKATRGGETFVIDIHGNKL